MEPSTILNSPNFGQCYLPPVPSLIDILNDSKLSKEAQGIVFLVVMVCTLAIVLLAEIIVAVANNNALNHRVSQLTKADKALNVLENTNKDTSNASSSVNASGKIADKHEAITKDDSIPGDYNKLLAVHKFLDSIQEQIHTAVSHANNEF